MEEELDYMSDDFLTKCLDTKADVRPGLLKTRSEQRQHEMIKKKKLADESKKKPAEHLQIEVLEKSLKEPINSSNKGFSMLEKMGFKMGMGLGKSNTGIVEPIAINLKNDKKGLGHKKPPKPTKENKSSLEKVDEGTFRAFLSQKNRRREILSDLRKSQRVCKELDLKYGKNKPDNSWFWPNDESEKAEDETDIVKEEIEEEEGDQEELSDEEKLQMLTRYLRNIYHFCIWCKIQYEDEKDMKDCPGNSRDDH